MVSLLFLPSFDKYMESVEQRLNASVPDMRKKAEQRGLEKEEEDYFNEDRYVIVFLLVISSLLVIYRRDWIFKGAIMFRDYTVNFQVK
jgi:hypothetical protein